MRNKNNIKIKIIVDEILLLIISIDLKISTHCVHAHHHMDLGSTVYTVTLNLQWHNRVTVILLRSG